MASDPVLRIRDAAPGQSKGLRASPARPRSASAPQTGVAALGVFSVAALAYALLATQDLRMGVLLGLSC